MPIRIRTKILLSFLSVFILLSFLGLVAVYNRNVLFRSMLALEAEVQGLEAISDLMLSFDRLVMPANDYLITGDASEHDKFMAISAEVESGFRRMEGFSADGRLAGVMRDARAGFGVIKGKSGDIFSIESPVGSKRGAALMEEMDALSADVIVRHLGGLYASKKEEINARMAAAGKARMRVDIVLLAVAILSVLTVLALGAYLFRSILRPILELRDGVAIIGKGNLDHRISLRDGVEINRLVEEFNSMASKLGKSHAELERKVEERTGELKEANALLKDLSVTDGLTGVFNHRHFYERLEDEIKRAGRYGRKLSVIISDIDHFKHYNDTNGHLAGDEVLRGVAQCIKGNLRDQDLVARYGGEEFSFILPETGKEEAILAAERIRRCVFATPFPHEETQPGENLTLSLGIASFPEDGKGAKDLVRAADAALYIAKESGRDRVVAA